MTPHGAHCGCAAYLRGVLANLKRTGCSCGAAVLVGDRCDNCKIIDRAMHKTRSGARPTAKGRKP